MRVMIWVRRAVMVIVSELRQDDVIDRDPVVKVEAVVVVEGLFGIEGRIAIGDIAERAVLAEYFEVGRHAQVTLQSQPVRRLPTCGCSC